MTNLFRWERKVTYSEALHFLVDNNGFDGSEPPNFFRKMEDATLIKECSGFLTIQDLFKVPQTTLLRDLRDRLIWKADRQANRRTTKGNSTND
jgi:hypothetical protein